MPRIQLRVYVNPGQVDVFCQLRFKDGTYKRLTGVVDTGAAVSLLPARFLADVEIEPTVTKRVTIDQAGIAGQSFEGIEALVTIVLEDQQGNSTKPFKIPAWFADTDEPLLGFAGVLDRAILHVDMVQQTAWLDING